MGTLSYEVVKQAVIALRDVEKIANALNCSIEAARNMKMIVDSRENVTDWPPPKSVMPERPPQENPKFHPLEWSYEREKTNMAVMSYELLKAMLLAGQHRLTQERANELQREMRIDHLLI